MNLFVIICIMTTLLGPALGKVMMCYLASWATYRPGKGNFEVSDIEPDLCTHFIYAFAGVTADGNIYDHGGKNSIGNLAALKKTKTAPKVLVSIGGWNAGCDTFTRVMSHTNSRAAFVKNIVSFLEKHHLDGLDMDWKNPCQYGGAKANKKGFANFTKELKAAFVKHKLLLTATVGAIEYIARWSYDIPALAKTVDYINVMTYDLTTAYFSKVVGHHAPMSAASHEAHDGLTQNSIEASIDFWLKSGAPASKLVLGLPLYGRTFTLADTSKTTPGSPSAGPGVAGPYTGTAGILGYNEFCEKELSGNWTTVWYEKQEVPYAYSGNQWIGFDNTKSLALKIKYAKKLGLAGIMFWSIDTDDFRGSCGCGRYRLLKASKAVLHSTRNAVQEVQEDVQD